LSPERRCLLAADATRPGRPGLQVCSLLEVPRRDECRDGPMKGRHRRRRQDAPAGTSQHRGRAP